MKQSDKIMPLLMCPSCNEGMREVNHNNLQIDVDPKCRGVWLDRGGAFLWKHIIWTSRVGARGIRPVRQAGLDIS